MRYHIVHIPALAFGTTLLTGILLTNSSVSAETNLRDNETYTIAKLADGGCWMIENLRLESNATKGNNQFNPYVANASLAQGYGT